MKKLIVAASCALALATGATQAQERDLRIAFDVPYEPFEYKNDNGELTGFEVELAEAMCEEMNANCATSGRSPHTRRPSSSSARARSTSRRKTRAL